MYDILCVDDTPANLLVLESLFEVYEDKYNIITAESGNDALGILLSQNIDIILLDVMMPGLSGFETAQLVKSNKKTKDIPILFLTAKRDNETIKDAFTYGVDYLSKPYDEFELITRVETQLKFVESQKQLQEQISFNKSILNAQQNITFIQDKDKIITANKSFLSFFNLKNIEEFNAQHKSISSLFMEYENYFSLHVLNHGEHWCNELSAQEDTEYNILMMDVDTFQPRAFKINVNNIAKTDKFVVSLTDITVLTTKSKTYEIKATYDALTNIYNRSKFNDLIEEYYSIFKRYNTPLSFAIFDIDFFKKVNDNFGHIIGDETLIKFAQTIDNATRDTDMFARWGGEEFVLLMPETSMDEAKLATDKLRQIIENTPFVQVGNVTCSIGVSQFQKGDTIDDILIRSDEALYEAKETGRNKVCTK